MTATAIIGAIVSVVGAVVSVTYGLISIRAQAQKEVGDLYDQMVRFRVEHPEVLRLGRQWKPGFLAKVYGQDTGQAAEWVIYYSYFELCIGYCNSVLAAKRRLSKRSYERHHEDLVKLILTEHNPIVEDLLGEGKYVSAHIKEFRQALERDGWNWREEHTNLVS